MKNVKSMDSATFYNSYWNTWGFFNCEADIYDTQDEAYQAYLESIKS